MNILLIGNGFDLAHGLPTKYTDFLEFVKMIKIIKEQNIFNNGFAISEVGCNVNNEKLHQAIRLTILNKANNNELARDSKELLDYIDHNFWIDYFLQCQSYLEENWIDFEGEIRNVIRCFHDNILNIDINNKASRLEISNDFLRDFFITDVDKLEQDRAEDLQREIDNYKAALTASEYSDYKNLYDKEHPKNMLPDITYREIMRKLEQDLNNLISALEIYIADYIDNIPVTRKSPDIELLLNGSDDNTLNRFISFNYTHTLNRVYGVEVIDDEHGCNFDFIHGAARKNRSNSANNIILGIDEYLSDGKENNDLRFIAFKKYYQRIYKETGEQSAYWADEIKRGYDIYKSKIEYAKERSLYKSSPTDNFYYKHNLIPVGDVFLERHNLYIFGHSLDDTDGDILRRLILNDNVYTTIFYHDEETHARQIANLVKVIHQDELIRRTGGSTKTIRFKPQQGMDEIKN